MNWDAESVRDERQGALLYAVNAFSEQVGRELPVAPLPVWGVGLVSLFGESRALLLIGDASWWWYPVSPPYPRFAPPFDSPYPRGFAIRSREDFAEALERSRSRLTETYSVSIEQMTGGILPQNTEVLFVGRPQALSASAGSPAVSSGDAIRNGASLERSTVGLPAERVDDQGQTRQGFLTAGHVASSVGDVIESVHKRRWSGTTFSPIGEVGLYVDPADTPDVAGYDAAVIDNLDQSPAVASPPKGTIASIPLDPFDEVPLNIYCGVSGMVNATIMAPMRDVARGERRWRDCWLIAPSGATVPGDSGSAAIIDDSSRDVAGLVVGAAYDNRGPRSVPLVQFVQDLESLNRDFLAPNNVTLV